MDVFLSFIDGASLDDTRGQGSLSDKRVPSGFGAGFDAHETSGLLALASARLTFDEILADFADFVDARLSDAATLGDGFAGEIITDLVSFGVKADSLSCAV